MAKIRKEQISSGSATDGQVLTADGSGGAAWEAASGGAALTVEEVDGTPTVANVSKIKVTNGTLTDNGSGEVQLDFGSAAADGSAIHDNVADEISAITEKTTPVSADMLIIEDSEASNVKKMVQIGNLPGGSGGVVDISLCNGRLTLETGVPVSTTDQTAKTTLYFTPYKGNRISLYDGSSAWSTLTFSELSLDISGYTADKNYDIWAYNNSGTVTLDSTIWTDNTTRATALALQDGVYVKTGATTRRYLGTIRITGTTGQCEDSVIKRYVWNYYNRLKRSFYKSEPTNHSYSTDAIRYANNNANNKIEVVVGVAEIPSFVSIYACAKTDGTGRWQLTMVGYDVASEMLDEKALIENSNTLYVRATGCIEHLTGIGYHYYSMLERASGAQSTWLEVRLDGSIFG